MRSIIEEITRFTFLKFIHIHKSQLIVLPMDCMSNICLMFVYNLFLRVGAIYSKTIQKKCGIGNSKKKKVNLSKRFTVVCLLP